MVYGKIKTLGVICMNKKEFIELQKEFSDVIIGYEKFCKKGYVLNMKFNYTFCEYLIKEQYLKYENKLLIGICTMLSDKKTLDEVDKFIKTEKNEYNKFLINHTNGVTRFAQVIKRLNEMPNEILDLLENAFEDYVYKYHPAVNFITTEDEFKFYDVLKQCYYESNYSMFKEMLDLNKKFLKSTNFDEELQIKATYYYYDIMNQIKLEVNNKKDKYPYNIEYVFEDKISIASYEGEIRARINVLQSANQALHKDVIKLFGEDVIL